MALERIEAPMAGRIISVNFSVGGAAKEGEAVCILEAMKMENPILSPVNGVVKEVKVSPGQVVQAGDLIAIIEY